MGAFRGSTERVGRSKYDRGSRGNPALGPSEEFTENTNISRYIRWLKEEKNLSFDSYEELWEWFVTDLEDFWASIWEYFDVIKALKPYEKALGSREMPGAE